jgi:general secretion pathway protein A
LLYAVRERKGCALLTGEYGCGKTTVIRALVRGLAGGKFDIAVVNNPRLTDVELLNEILYQLGDDRQSDKRLELSRTVGDVLYRNFNDGKHTLIIVDEAQLIRDEGALEELRLLTNYQLEDRFLLSLLLVGQPELADHLRAIPQLDQRVAVRHHLRSFDLDDTANYILHRLRISGLEKQVFIEEAIKLIFRASDGIPRKINNICDLCLLAGANKNAQAVDPETVKSVI